MTLPSEPLGALGVAGYECDFASRAMRWFGDLELVSARGGAPPDLDSWLARIAEGDRHRHWASGSGALEPRHFALSYAFERDTGELMFLREEGRVLEGGRVVALLSRRCPPTAPGEEEQRRAEEEIRRSLEEKSVLLREIHHRVKNNLQVISSLLYLQSTRVVDAGVRQLFQESRHRILSMAYIHETLYQSADLSRVDFPAYLRKLVGGLATSHASLAPNVEIVSDVENAELGLDAAVPCGLIVNELITNALKYAFPDGRRGSISVLFRKLPSGDHELRVCDDGVGLPDRIGQDAPTLGLELVRSLVEQLHATLTVDRAFGTCFCITFPPLPLRG